MKNKKIGLFLVHNYNKDRDSFDKSRQDFDELVGGLSSEMVYGQYGWQPEVAPLSRWRFFCRTVRYIALQVSWSGYLSDRRSKLRIILSFVPTLFKSLGLSKSGSSLRKRACIEGFVTDKHIRCWSRALEEKCSLAIIFEDDAIIDRSSLINLVRVLSSKIIDFQDALYVDLAGGFPLEKVSGGLLKNNEKLPADWIHLVRPITNTACVYAVNDKLIEYFLSRALSSPAMRELPIDWFMNNIFLRSEKEGFKVSCFHAFPSVFEHGSFTGKYPSWGAVL
ncbi:MAG: hypothetical protein ACK4FF_03020 [Limnobacter sp.]|uniref:hypothetical protein n=1 Tax=Limnobacter sp. TaxID=2003368 RepID=UPI00391AFC66